MALSPKEIQQIIDRATDNPQSLVEWLGNGGLKVVLTAMNNNAVLRGVMAFADTTSMSLAGGTDSEFAVCVNGSAGLNYYRYYPNIDSTITGGITSLVGGQWRPIYASQDVVTGPFEIGDYDDIIPIEAARDMGLAIGKATCKPNLWLDIEAIGDDGKGRTAKLPVLTTAVINAMTTIEANSLVVNSEDKMLLRYDDFEGNMKSAGVFAGYKTASISVSQANVDITFDSEQHVNNYKVYITPTNSYSGALLVDTKYYITNKTSTGFRIAFPVVPTSAGTLSFDFQISH